MISYPDSTDRTVVEPPALNVLLDDLIRANID